MTKPRNINYARNLKEYLSLASPYKWHFTAIITIITLIELLRLAPKFLFAQIIDSGALYTSGEITKAVLISGLWTILIAFLAITLFRSIFTWYRVKTLIHIDSNMTVDLKRKYFNHLIGLDTEFHNSHKTGSMISRIGRGAGAIEGLTDTFFFQFLPVIIQLIAVAISLAYFSLAPAIILVVTSVAFVIYSTLIQNKQKPDKLNYNDAEDLEKGIMADFFMNVESIKYFGKEKVIKDKYKTITHETREKGYKYWNWYKYFDTGQSFILGIGTILILLFPVIQFINGEITVGTVSFIYTAYFGFMGSLYGFVWGIRGYYRTMTDLESLFEYSKFNNEIKDKKNAKEIQIKKGKIEFKNIGFQYPKGENIFDRFNLIIPAGKKIALVGHSGCGKTSLIKLLYRMYDLNEGSINIDGTNIKDIKQESLRSEMAVVSQEPILFDDTIYNNIKFSNPKASRREVMKAIKFAQLDKVIEKLDKKEHTIVGERGVKLSGGQKQRVSIARAILANKKVLVLDEATSALDSETEHEIQKDLERLMKGRTSIIIAHRLSTIMKADIIVVLKEGKIEQMGTHRELITEGGEYARLWEFQKGGYIE